MSVEVVLGEYSVAYHLSKDIGVNVRYLLAYYYLGDYLGSSCNEANSHAGGDHLGEASCVNNSALSVKRLDRGDILACKSQFAVGVVFKDNEVILAGKVINSLSAGSGHTSSRGVLEVGDNIKELDVLVFLNSIFKVVCLDALIVHFDSHKL